MYYLVRTDWNGDDRLGGYVYSTNRDCLLHMLYDMDDFNFHSMSCDFKIYKQYYDCIGNCWNKNDPDLPFLGDNENELDYQYVPFKIEELDAEELKAVIEV